MQTVVALITSFWSCCAGYVVVLLLRNSRFLFLLCSDATEVVFVIRIFVVFSVRFCWFCPSILAQNECKGTESKNRTKLEENRRLRCRSIARVCLSVRLSVCLSVCLQISTTLTSPCYCTMSLWSLYELRSYNAIPVSLMLQSLGLYPGKPYFSTDKTS